MIWKEMLELAQLEVLQTIALLPTDLRVRAETLPVTYERVPSGALIGDGIEADTLGLFVGGDFVQAHDVPMPAHIILFLENIRIMVEGAKDDYRREVRITYMHELGHYLGLDEDDLDERGLL